MSQAYLNVPRKGMDFYAYRAHAEGCDRLTVPGSVLGVMPDIVEVENDYAEQQKDGHDAEADRSNVLRHFVYIPEQLFEKLQHR
jgi:hypothetical protein